MIFRELRKRVQKVGQPPGTATYTGRKKLDAKTLVTVMHFTGSEVQESTGTTLEACLPQKKEDTITWIHVEGLQNVELIQQLAKEYAIHPLTVEDILNLDQRPKVEEYEGYVFITLKMLNWRSKRRTFSSEQVSFVLGKNFLISFQDCESDHFRAIRERLRSNAGQTIRQLGCDYLAYRLMDSIVDYYFVVLEGLGEQIEQVEDLIIENPTPQNTRTIYRLRRQLMMVRKSVWPMREAISHLTQLIGTLVTSTTRIYLRDLYDHVVQAIDMIETFREMLSSMLDIYISSLTNRMNEVMKTLTIIATIFIPITFIASLYGMNFQNMPELHWRYGYLYVVLVMSAMVLGMIVYFRKKKWI